MFGTDGKVSEHQGTMYHKNAWIRAEECKHRFSNPLSSVDCLVNSHYQKQVGRRAIYVNVITDITQLQNEIKEIVYS